MNDKHSPSEHDHALKHIAMCDECYETLFEYFKRSLVAKAGSTKSERKAQAARENGKLGGRPRKND